MTIIPNGIYVPMITPFSPADESVDLAALRENTLRLSETPIAGLMPLGSNGEFRSLSDEESLMVLRTVRRSIKRWMALFAGAARESAHATVEWIKRCQGEGADAAFVLTPSFFAKTVGEQGLLRYYAAVADGSPLPILLYAAPGYAAGVELPPGVVRILSEHPNCIGMKDTSKQPVDVYREFCGPSFSMLAGSQGKLLDWLEAGAVGGVLSAANYAPNLCARLFSEYIAGHIDSAREIDRVLRNMGAVVSGCFGVAGVKKAADLCGYSGGVPRNPYGRITEEGEMQIVEAIDSLKSYESSF